MAYPNGASQWPLYWGPTPAMLADSHCHLTLLDLDAGASVTEVLHAAREHGVERLLCVSVDLDSYPAVLALARRHAEVSASVGVHPNTQTGEEPSCDTLAALARDPRVVAIGETGLDYYRSPGDMAWQQARFRRHIAAARAVGKPIIVHTRQAAPDVIRILGEEQARDVGGVMHCFVEDWDTARAAMDLGFYVSFSGIVTFRNAREVQEVARRVPLDRLLVETDAPYLAPVPHRGKENRPAYVRYVAEHIAALREVPAQVVFEATTANYRRLFAVD